MHASLFKRFFVHLECIPFPGPPDEKELAFPSMTLNMLYSSIFEDLY
jgi:hypothetical protein